MSNQDQISDMLTRIRNAQKSLKPTVSMDSSTVKAAIAAVLKNEGYVTDFAVEAVEGSACKKTLTLTLKYYNRKPVIELIKRISRPGLRAYKPVSDLPRVLDGFGIAILSTSKGVMTEKAARQLGVGGEVLCHVA
jgi:small subunit ribosomal protein S8